MARDPFLTSFYLSPNQLVFLTWRERERKKERRGFHFFSSARFFGLKGISCLLSLRRSFASYKFLLKPLFSNTHTRTPTDTHALSHRYSHTHTCTLSLSSFPSLSTSLTFSGKNKFQVDFQPNFSHTM